MNKEKIKEFELLYNNLKLSHHNFRRMMTYLSWCFDGIDFNGKSVLDIGGGNGIYSFYSKLKGASSVLNLEPFSAGSTTFNLEGVEIIDNLKISINNQTIQDFKMNKSYDIIILHDSINHLDENIFKSIHQDEDKFKEYKKLISKIVKLLSINGQILITDCSRRNFWGDLGLKNPFAPTIDWHLHQRPTLVLKLFENHNFEKKIRWSPFKRFGLFGYFISSLGFIPSYFLQSHFNICISKISLV